mmetsp:Transcript_604/g.2040  ORF Transcript_604/g.2040 Transcript_604/m.2040 type:complete len:232 (-) Transcript_604:565-1260(-)
MGAADREHGGRGASARHGLCAGHHRLPQLHRVPLRRCLLAEDEHDDNVDDEADVDRDDELDIDDPQGHPADKHFNHDDGFEKLPGLRQGLHLQRRRFDLPEPRGLGPGERDGRRLAPEAPGLRAGSDGVPCLRRLPVREHARLVAGSGHPDRDDHVALQLLRKSGEHLAAAPARLVLRGPRPRLLRDHGHDHPHHHVNGDQHHDHHHVHVHVDVDEHFHHHHKLDDHDQRH